MISGIHHLAIIAYSEESVSFYSKLGFKEIYRNIRETDTVVILDGYEIQLTLFIDSSHPKRAEEPENQGLRHLALKVDDCEEISRRYSCTPIMTDWFGVKYCYTKDPDGIPIQFH